MTIKIGPGITFNDNTVQLSAPAQLKNRIINGRMNVDQVTRGIISSSLTPLIMDNYQTAYFKRTIDRWIFNSVGSPGSVRGKVTTPNVVGSNNKVLRFTTTDTGVTGLVGFAQRIESIYTQDLKNQTVTLSLKAAAFGSGSGSTVYYNVYYPNIKDEYIDVGYTNGIPVYYNCTEITSGNFTVNNATGALQSFGVTFNAGPNAINGLMVYFYTQVTNNSSECSFSITEVQLEKGGTVSVQVGASVLYTTPGVLDNRSYAEELKLCQRYLYSEGVTANSSQYTTSMTVGHDAMRFEAHASAGSNGIFQNFGTLKFDFKVPMKPPNANNLTGASQCVLFESLVLNPAPSLGPDSSYHSYYNQYGSTIGFLRTLSIVFNTEAYYANDSDVTISKNFYNMAEFHTIRSSTAIPGWQDVFGSRPTNYIYNSDTNKSLIGARFNTVEWNNFNTWNCSYGIGGNAGTSYANNVCKLYTSVTTAGNYSYQGDPGIGIYSYGYGPMIGPHVYTLNFMSEL